MKELDRFIVADGEPDIRGWTVFTSTGREIGTVEDLLVDVDAGEVVMLDVDLKRNDRHTLAPIRAAWIDRASKRVVLDATELSSADIDAVPELPRRGAMSDQDVERFNDQYVRAYGDRGYDADREWELRHGEEDLRFGRRRADTRDVDVVDRDVVDRHPGLGAAGLGTAAAGGMMAAGQRDERLERERREREYLESERVERDRLERERLAAERMRADRLRDEARGPDELEAARRREVHGDIRDDLRREGVDERGAPVFDESRRINDEMRAARAADIVDDGGIDPRELDARTRIDEGGRVDANAPVGGVVYDSPAHPSHDYGRPDERYGPEYGSGRIGFDRVVSRHQRVEADAAEVARRLDDTGDRRRVVYPSHLEDPADERRRRALDDLGRRSEERR